jgi:hypothetical protein
MLQFKLDPRFCKKSHPPAKGAHPEECPLAFYLTCGLLIIAVLALDLGVPLGVAVVILYNAVVLLSLRTRNRTFIIAVTVIASLLTIVPLFHKDPIYEMWKAASNRVLALFSIWAACSLGLQRLATEEKREQALREREKAIEEVRVLRGFLPICSSCKKIRSMEGSWTMLEKYIVEHSEAEFSHGLCPECTRTLFPQFFERDKKP